MKIVKCWARWNRRTGQLAPLGDLVGYPPNLYATKDEAFRTIQQYRTIDEEMVVEVEVKIPAKGLAQFDGLLMPLRRLKS